MKSKNFDFKKKYNIDSEFILFLGRFSKIKGLDTLIQSINILKNGLYHSWKAYKL